VFQFTKDRSSPIYSLLQVNDIFAVYWIMHEASGLQRRANGATTPGIQDKGASKE